MAGVRKTASLAAQILVRHNVMQVMSTPTKNVVSQVRIFAYRLFFCF